MNERREIGMRRDATLDEVAIALRHCKLVLASAWRDAGGGAAAVAVASGPWRRAAVERFEQRARIAFAIAPV